LHFEKLLGAVMSDQSLTSHSEATQPRDPVINPAPNATINHMGFWFLLLTVVFFYLLITTWPVLEDGGKAFKTFNIFGISCSWAPDRHLMFMMMAGALGSLTHTLTSFGDYLGNRELSTNWIWFFVLRIPIGIALAIFFYFVIRGGLLIPTVQVQPMPLDQHAATLQVNAYSIAAFAALAGMFSKQATDKLGAVFDAVFAMKKPVQREGALGSSQPLRTVPPQLTKGKREDLIVVGSGFQKDTKATIGGTARTFTMLNDTQGRVAILDDDVKNTGTLDLVVRTRTTPHSGRRSTLWSRMRLCHLPLHRPKIADRA
jgi:hypothetical protein